MSDLDTGTEAIIIAAGRYLWDLARADMRYRGLEAADVLILALDTYDAIHARAISPAGIWADLRGDPQPWDTGLRRAAEAVLHASAEVIRAAPALAGGHAVNGADGWTVEGVILCPGECGLYFDFCGTPQDLHDFITAHDCATAPGGFS